MELPGRYHNLDSEQTDLLKQYYKLYYEYVDSLPTEKVDLPVIEEKKGFSSLRSRLPKMMQKTNSESSVSIGSVNSIAREEFKKVVIGQTQFDHVDSVMLRYIRARKWDLKESLNMFTTAIEWFFTADIIDIKKKGEANVNMDLFRKNQFFMQGVDKVGRPVCYVIAKLHDPKALTMEELQNFVLTVMESARLLIVEPADTVTIVFDLSDMSMNNMDYNSVKFLITCLEKYYPESLGQIIALNAPWFFSGVWKVLSPLIDPVVAAKIKFLSTKELTDYIDPSQLREEQGGTGELNYQYIDAKEDENLIMKDVEAYEKASKDNLDAWVEFDNVNREWCKSSSDELNDKRSQSIKKVQDTAIILDPFIRARTIYHRIGVARGFNNVDWDAVKKQ